MGKVAIRPILALLAVPLVAILLCLGFQGAAVLQMGYSWSEMDWNADGSTSLSEFFDSSDIGKRDVTRDGRRCDEYFAYKDGLPVKTICK